MPSGIYLLMIVLVVFAASLWYLIDDQGGLQELWPLMQRGLGVYTDTEVKGTMQPDVPAHPVASLVPALDLTSGQSRFSQGSCQSDAECFVGGCSGEVCGSDADIVTTCEFSDAFPSTATHACGCVNSACGWE